MRIVIEFNGEEVSVEKPDYINFSESDFLDILVDTLKLVNINDVEIIRK